jgi:hypothetical protein
MIEVDRLKGKIEMGQRWFVFSVIFFITMAIPVETMGQEVHKEGWAIPDLKGLIPYSIQVNQVDGVEKMVEKFYTPDGGQVARIRGNGKIFAYAVDNDREPPIAYLLIDPDGFGKFTQKFRSKDLYKIPEWVSH